MTDLNTLKQQAKLATNKPKISKDVVQPSDTLVVLPKDELEACIEALYYTLEHSTSDYFDKGVRKSMLAALKRLE